MNIEYILIRIFLNKEYYNLYFSYLKLDFYKDNNKEIYRLFVSLKSLQEKENRDYSLEEFILYFFTLYPHLKPDDKELYNAIFQKVSDAAADETLIVDYLTKQRQQAVAAEAAILALDVAQGRKQWDEFITLVGKEEVPVVNEEILFVTDNLQELYDAKVLQQGLRWRLDTLNKIFGSLRKGNFGFLFARPETGKTTFLASEISFMAAQVDSPIIWFNNEEPGEQVATRCYQATLGMTVEQLYANRERNYKEYQRLTKGNLKIYDDAGLSKKTVERICKQLNPSMIVFDQIDKIHGFDAERYDLKMKTIYQWARELSKTYGPTLGVCQAGGTAEGKRYLSMNDVDSSHTAKQGEADFMLGIGTTNNAGEEYIRYLSACKNKLQGDTDTKSELRHGQVQVNILPEIARYDDIMKWN